MLSFKHVTKSIYSYHWTALQRLTSSTFFCHYDSIEEKFFQYYYKQLGMEEFENKLIAFKQVIEARTKEIQDNLLKEFDLALNVNWDTSRRINNKIYVFNNKLIEEHDSLVAPLQRTSQLLTKVDGFAANESHQVLGANWRLQKLFPMFRATKKINPDYVLLPEVVENFVNCYFMYIQFGGEQPSNPKD